jgi:hypothetical protein
MADQPAPAGERRYKAADDTIAEVLKFSPRAYGRTLLAVLETVLPGRTRLADAVGAQDWQALLSPFKFLAASIVLFTACATYLELEEKDSFAKLISPAAAIPLLLTAAGFVPLHWLLGKGGAARAVAGLADGVTKMVQVNVYILGTLLLPLTVLMLANASPASSAITWLVLPMAGLIVALSLVGFPRVIGRVYDVGFTRAWMATLGWLVGSSAVSIMIEALSAGG